MVLDWWGGAKGASLEELIARKKYGKAIEILRDQFKEGSRDPRMRMQLADVLVLAGKGRDAVPILVGLSDEFAREGFAAKAIAVLKKVEKVEPGRKEVARKLASLIEHQKESTGSFLVPKRQGVLPEIGIEEIHEAPAEIAQALEARPPKPAPLLPTLELRIEEEGMTEAAFDLELHDLIEENFSTPVPAGGVPAATGSASTSPLFSDFTEEELLAVIQGLDLLTFEPGDLIVTEGEAGDSLFILTTGTAKVFVRSPSGRNVRVREMEEGSFFGEISILTGKPRTATVTAATRCELLELDRQGLDSVARSHPRVREVLERFYEERAMSAEEARARRASEGGVGNLKYLGVALAGGLVGAIVGLLFAPAPGRETRRRLGRRIAEEKEALLRKGHQTLSRINDVMGA